VATYRVNVGKFVGHDSDGKEQTFNEGQTFDTDHDMLKYNGDGMTPKFVLVSGQPGGGNGGGGGEDDGEGTEETEEKGGKSEPKKPPAPVIPPAPPAPPTSPATRASPSQAPHKK
jgi:hypothetical protein